MHYVISDIHGEYDKYIQLLEKIDLKDQDTLYILGDIVDRGLHPIRVLLDMMERDNVIPIIGNHEYMAACNMKFLLTEITEDSIKQLEQEKQLKQFSLWMQNGGQTTLNEFMQLSLEQKKEVYEYLIDFMLYENIEVNQKEYVLVHAGLSNFSPLRPLDDYELYEMIFKRADYTKVYFDDRYLITGHTPTMIINNHDHPGSIYTKNNHIAIDCGCVFGGKLAAYCLETAEEFYI